MLIVLSKGFSSFRQQYYNGVKRGTQNLEPKIEILDNVPRAGNPEAETYLNSNSQNLVHGVASIALLLLVRSLGYYATPDKRDAQFILSTRVRLLVVKVRVSFQVPYSLIRNSLCGKEPIFVMSSRQSRLPYQGLSHIRGVTLLKIQVFLVYSWSNLKLYYEQVRVFDSFPTSFDIALCNKSKEKILSTQSFQTPLSSVPTTDDCTNIVDLDILRNTLKAQPPSRSLRRP